MGLKGKIEAVIYAAEEPVTLEQISLLVKQAVLHKLAEEQASAAAQPSEQADTENATSSQQEQAAEQSTEQGTEPMVPIAEPGAQGDGAVPVAGAPVPAQPDELAQSASELLADTPETTAEEAATPEAAVESTPEQLSASEPATVDAAENAASPVISRRKPKNEIPPEVKTRVREIIEELISDYASPDRGIEIRRIAGGFRMATKPEHHDVVKAFAKSLKPPLKLSLPALETLAVVAYKQPVTAPEVSEIRGVDSQGVIATLLDRKLITTAGRKAVIGRPILYKTTKEFLLRFGLKDVSELPSMEEFEKLAQDAGQVDMFQAEEEAPVVQSTLHDVEPDQDSESADSENTTTLAENALEATRTGEGAAIDSAPETVESERPGVPADSDPQLPASEESIES